MLNYIVAFENLNYSTEDRDDDSVQDCIDREHQDIRENLRRLKDDILSNFETVQVDIFEAGSHLNMRSRDGHIIGKLHDNDTLHVLWDHILWPNKKVFLHIRTGSWKEGYVSADYVQWDYCPAPEEPEEITDSLPELQDTPPVVQDTVPTLDQPMEDIIEEQIVLSPYTPDPIINRKAPQVPYYPETDTLPNITDTLPVYWWEGTEPPQVSYYPERDIPNVLQTEPEEVREVIPQALNILGFMRAWAMYIVWENGKDTLITHEWFNEQQQENIDLLWALSWKVDNFILILQALKLDAWSDRFDAVEQSLTEIVQSIDITSDASEVEASIRTLQVQLGEMTKQNMWMGNFSNRVAGLDLWNSLQVLSYIRNNLSQSELASQEILNLRFELLWISNESLSDFIADPTTDIASIRAIFWDDEDAYIEFKTDINNRRGEATNYFIEHKDEIMESQNIDENTAKELVIQSFLGTYTQSKLMTHYITHLDDTGYWVGYEWNDELLKLYSDIHWIGANDLSDSTWNLIWEWAKLLAIEAIAIWAGMLTLWVWTAVIHAAVWGARWYKWVRALQGISRVADLWYRAGEYNRLRIMWARALRFWTMWGIEGVSFAVGMWAAKSVIEWENMYTRDMLVQSLGFTYAFRWLTWVYSSLWMRINPEIPLSAQKLTVAGQIGWDGVAFSALGLWFEDVLFEPWEWSAETILQAFFMAALFRWMWYSLERYKFRKNDEGNIEIIPQSHRITDQRWIIPEWRRLTDQRRTTETPLLANPVIPSNRLLTHIREMPSPSLRETVFINPRNNDRYVIFGTPDRIISVRLEKTLLGGNGVLWWIARNTFIWNNEAALLRALRSVPPINNQAHRRIEFKTPEGPNGWWNTYEIFATQRSGNWEYYVIIKNSSLPHSWNLWTAVLRDFQARYGDQILELLNRA